jgi:hypothetical protein
MSKDNKRDRKQDPEEVAFLNVNSLAFIDELFYRLPFPDIGRLEKLQLDSGITSDIARFHEEIKEDYANPRFMEDLRQGWMEYLESEMRGPAKIYRTKISMSQRHERNKSPTPSEVEAALAAQAAEAEICLPSLLHQHR